LRAVEKPGDNLGENLWKTLLSLWKTPVENSREKFSPEVIHRREPLFHSLSTAFSTGENPVPLSPKLSFPQN